MVFLKFVVLLLLFLEEKFSPQVGIATDNMMKQIHLQEWLKNFLNSNYRL